MKISQETINILKNYSTINSNIIIEPGKTLKTFATSKTIMAIASIEEDFPKEVCIYDMHIFLGVLTLFDEPDIDFKEKYMVISESEGKSIKLKYFYAAKNVIPTAKCGIISLPDSLVKFILNESDLHKLVRASATLKLEDFTIESDGNRVSLSVFNKEDDKGCNRFSVDVGEGNGDEYQIIIKVKNLLMIQGTYDVEVCKTKPITQFKNVDKDITYYIAIDPTSKQ